jgi:hypothetical protein
MPTSISQRIEVHLTCIRSGRLVDWAATACLVEPGRRAHEVIAVGSSQGVPDEEVAIRLALLNLSEKVDYQDYELIAIALVHPFQVVVDRYETAIGTQGLLGSRGIYTPQKSDSSRRH